MKARTSSLWAALLATVIAGQAISAQDKLAEGFANPPDSAKPYTWWHWVGGGVTKDGITGDLEAMARVGLGGFHLFNINGYTPGVREVKMFSPEWTELVRHVFAESARLGLDAGVQNCPGFETAGGPWITPEFGQQEVVWSETRVRGGGPVAVPLPRPAIKYAFGQWFNYSDIAALAVPVPPAEQADFRKLVTKVTCTPAPSVARVKYSVYMVPNVDVTFGPDPADPRALVDGRLDTGFMLPVPTAEQPVVIEFELAAPFTARGFELGCLPVYGAYPVQARLRIEALAPGATAYTKVGEFKVAHLRGTEDCIAARCYLTLDPVTATKFRVTFTSAALQVVSGLLPAEMVFHGLGRSLNIKAIASNRIGDVRYTRGATGPQLFNFDPATVVDVSPFLATDGTLRWEAPAGEWLVLRFGHSCTGSPIKPVPQGMEGLDCDKMSKAAFDLHWEKGIQPYLAAAGDRVGKSFTTILFDSMECEWQNWTAQMPAEFQKRRGYSILPWLPLFANLSVADPEAQDQFKEEFGQTLSDLFQENFFDYSCEVIRRHGLQVAREPYSTGGFSSIKAGRNADIPMSEFWMNTKPEANAEEGGMDRIAASIARQYGQRLVGAEAFTQGSYIPYADHPFTMKRRADQMLAAGINRFYFHTFAHQAHNDRVPGMNMGWWGFQMNRHQTWWELAGSFMKYLARCGWMLQEGDFVGDVVAWTPNETFYAAGCLTTQDWRLEGHDYTVIGSDTFLKNTRVTSAGRIAFAPRQEGAVLVLTYADRMSVEELRQLDRLVQAGAVLVGAAPRACKTDPAKYGGEYEALVKKIWQRTGAVYPISITGKNDAELVKILRARGILPDLEIPGEKLKTAGTGFRYLHRRNADADWYFLSNQEGSAKTVAGIFRVAGRVPELWHPDTGQIESVAGFETLPDGRLRVPLQFDPFGSVFVVFRKTSAPAPVIACRRLDEINLDAGWQVAFQEKRGAPSAITLDKLASLSLHPESGVRHFSGIATYRREFTVPADWLAVGRRVVLDLGGVAVIAAVRVNGRALEPLWKPPFRCDITAALRPGANTLEVRVANTWINRIKLDSTLPESERLTWSSFYGGRMDIWDDVRELPPSGLLGPVTLQLEQEQKEAIQ